MERGRRVAKARRREERGKAHHAKRRMIILEQLSITFYYFLGESLRGFKLLERTRSAEGAKNSNFILNNSWDS